MQHESKISASVSKGVKKILIISRFKVANHRPKLGQLRMGFPISLVILQCMSSCNLCHTMNFGYNDILIISYWYTLFIEAMALVAPFIPTATEDWAEIAWEGYRT